MPVALVMIVGMGGGLLVWLTPQVLRRLDRWLEIQADRYAKPEPVAPKDPMPEDIAALAFAYPEEWAREDTVKRLQELYEESGNWDRVRSAAKALRIGES